MRNDGKWTGTTWTSRPCSNRKRWESPSKELPCWPWASWLHSSSSWPRLSSKSWNPTHRSSRDPSSWPSAEPGTTTKHLQMEKHRCPSEDGRRTDAWKEGAFRRASCNRAVEGDGTRTERVLNAKRGPPSNAEEWRDKETLQVPSRKSRHGLPCLLQLHNDNARNLFLFGVL